MTDKLPLDIALQTYKSEESMRIHFWRDVKQYQLNKIIPEYAIYANSNNQRGKGQHRAIKQIMDARIGVVAGISDYTVTGIGYLEAKRWYYDKKGKLHHTYLEPEQKDFRDYALSKGQKFAIFYTPREGIDILLDWLGIQKQ